MTWILEDGDGNSREIDDEDEAQDQKKSLEQLGKVVNLREVDDESETDTSEVSEDGETDVRNGFSESIQEDDDIDAEVIEMSGGDGGNENGQDDDEDLEIIGDGGRPYVYCDNCNRLSTCAYRCPDSECGADLAGKPFYRGGDDE